MNTCIHSAAWLNIIACELSFLNNGIWNVPWRLCSSIFFYRLPYGLRFCSPDKLQDYLSGLGFDLVFIPETSGMGYLNYTLNKWCKIVSLFKL